VRQVQAFDEVEHDQRNGCYGQREKAFLHRIFQQLVFEYPKQFVLHLVHPFASALAA